MSGFRVLDGVQVYELTWTKANYWHAGACACPGVFGMYERFHLGPAGIRVLPHPSSAVLACIWDGIAIPRRGAPYETVRRATDPLFHALRKPITAADVKRLSRDV